MLRKKVDSRRSPTKTKSVPIDDSEIPRGMIPREVRSSRSPMKLKSESIDLESSMDCDAMDCSPNLKLQLDNHKKLLGLFPDTTKNKKKLVKFIDSLHRQSPKSVDEILRRIEGGKEEIDAIQAAVKQLPTSFDVDSGIISEFYDLRMFFQGVRNSGAYSKEGAVAARSEYWKKKTARHCAEMKLALNPVSRMAFIFDGGVLREVELTLRIYHDEPRWWYGSHIYHRPEEDGQDSLTFYDTAKEANNHNIGVCPADEILLAIAELEARLQMNESSHHTRMLAGIKRRALSLQKIYEESKI